MKELSGQCCSDYASPVVLVTKKDCMLQLCVDYQELNKKIVWDRSIAVD